MTKKDIPLEVRCQRVEGDSIVFENQIGNLYTHRRLHKQVERFTRVDWMNIFKFRVMFRNLDGFFGLASVRVLKQYKDQEVLILELGASEYETFQRFYKDYVKDCPVAFPSTPDPTPVVSILEDGGLSDSLFNAPLHDGGLSDSLPDSILQDGGLSDSLD